MRRNRVEGEQALHLTQAAQQSWPQWQVWVSQPQGRECGTDEFSNHSQESALQGHEYGLTLPGSAPYLGNTVGLALVKGAQVSCS